METIHTVSNAILLTCHRQHMQKVMKWRNDLNMQLARPQGYQDCMAAMAELNKEVVKRGLTNEI